MSTVIITRRARDVWLGPAGKRFVCDMQAAIEAGRMPTDSEMWALSLWLAREPANGRDTFVVSESEDVVFVIAYDQPEPIVTAIIPLSKAMRAAVELRRERKARQQAHKEWRRIKDRRQPERANA